MEKKPKWRRNLIQNIYILFWLLCLLFPETYFTQIFITGESKVVDLENNITNKSGKIINVDSLQTSKIFITKGTKTHNLEKNSTAVIAYISIVRKNNFRSITKNQEKKRKKTHYIPSENQNTEKNYIYCKPSSESESFLTCNLSQVKVIDNNNIQLKYINSSQNKIVFNIYNLSGHESNTSNNTINSFWKDEDFTVRPPPFGSV